MTTWSRASSIRQKIRSDDILFVHFLPDQLQFDRSDETVSVVVGKRALLPCYVSIQDAKTANNGQGPFKVRLAI